MTFRLRVITATVAAAAIAVVLACVASYLSTRNAELRAVDDSLEQTAAIQQGPGHDDFGAGSGYELVLPSGESYPAYANIPVDKTIKAVASGKAGKVLRTVSFDGQSYRELIEPVAANSIVPCSSGLCQATTTMAEVYAVNISGQLEELHDLSATLILVALGGLLIAFALGVFLARQALHPLEEVTDEIEAVAKTNDLQHRLDEGGPDELGRLRRVFNGLLRSVDESQQQQRQLVMDASHELRTPLTSLRTNAQVLSRAAGLEPGELHQITDDMVTQVDELATLVTDLGELARGERSEGELVALRLDDCVDECVETARTYARLRSVTIDVEAEPSFVLGRHDRLTRALSNLLTNAVKFSPEGGRIVVRSQKGTVSVSDSGPGISAEDRPFVFDRFWRSPSARALPGSGLGLSIVAQVVSEFHGSVTVDRDPELGGARFTLVLPEAEPSPAP